MKHILSSNVWRGGMLAAALCSFVVGTASLEAAPAPEAKKAPESSKSNADQRKWKQAVF